VASRAETGAVAPARWTRYQWYAVVLLFAVNVFCALDRFVLGTLQEHIKGELHLSDAQLGIIAGPAFSLFYILSTIPVARLAERIDRAKLLATVLGFWSSATAVCGLSGGFVSLLLCRVGVGLGEGGSHPISQSMIADQFDARQRGSAMSIYAAGSPVAAIIAPIVGGAVAHWFGWRMAFIAVGLPGVLLAVVLWFTLREPRKALAATAAERPKSSFMADLRWAFRNHAFVCIFVAGAFNGVAITGITAFTTSFVMRTQGLDIATAGLFVGSFGAIGLLGTFLGGFLADRFADARGRSYVNVCAAGSVLALGCYLVAFTQQSWPLVMAGLFGANLAINLKNGPNFAAIQNIVPSRMRATAAAIFTVASNVIGMGLGALIVGVLSDAFTAAMFDSARGDFASLCVGVEAAKAAASGCAAASASGLRTALSIVTLCFAGAAAFYYLAGTRIRISDD
jgi:predicted MFS family arabinose efflux permease